MLIGFTREENIFAEMLSYMEKNWPGYQMDFVFNPLNPAVSRVLEKKGAALRPRQFFAYASDRLSGTVITGPGSA